MPCSARRTARRAATFVALVLLHLAFLGAMRRRIGPERPTPADILTGSRAACAAAILTSATVGPAQLTPEQARRLVLLALLASTVTDWLDGPLARRCGPTRLGAVMDIEADSLLTLALAVAAVRWGRLPALVLVPPIMRYGDLVRTVRRGAIFSGDAIWWCRVTGGAQMLLFLVALAPCPHERYRRSLRRVAVVIASLQLATQVRDGRRRFGSRSVSVC